MTLGIIFIFILFFALLGTPLFIIMSLLGLTAFSFTDVDLATIGIEIYRISSAPTLLTIPLFTFAGYMMAASRAPQRLFRLVDVLFGHFRGGVPIVSLSICALFTTLTGASGATIIALGGLLYPILRKEGYSEKFSLGLLTTSGSLGLLFPPSLPIILYGLVAKLDIDMLFKAGIVPGILLMIVLSIWSIYNSSKKSPAKHTSKTFSFLELYRAFKMSFFEAILPPLILYGIYGGFVTPTEAASLAAFYILIVECFVYKDLSWRIDIPRLIVESSTLVGAILLILCCALGFTNYLIDREIPFKILEFAKENVDNKYIFLLFLNIFLLAVGSLIDIFSAIIVVVPIISPIAIEFGIHPIHLAIIFLTNLEIGYITPPVGINLFISSFKFKRPVVDLYRASFPYLVLLLSCLLIITYFPILTLLFID